jgi:hypothetical protein
MPGDYVCGIPGNHLLLKRASQRGAKNAVDVPTALRR